MIAFFLKPKMKLVASAKTQACILQVRLMTDTSSNYSGNLEQLVLRQQEWQEVGGDSWAGPSGFREGYK